MTTKRTLLTEKQMADELQRSHRTLAKGRTTGYPDIPYIKIGASVRYDLDEVNEWLAKHTHNCVEG